MNNQLAQNMNRKNGQIVVVFAVSLVVILVIAALAVDGGMIYTDKRFAQNAADAASLSGGGAVLYSGLETKTFVCPQGSSYNSGSKVFADYTNLIAKAYMAAKNTAGINDFSTLPYLGYIRNGVVKEDHGINEKHGVVVECDTQTKNKFIDVTVRISSKVTTAFAHLIFPDSLVSTNEAVTRVEPGHNIGYGNAIVSLSDACQNKVGGTYFEGSAASIKIKGAGTHSNSCLKGTGNNIQIVIDNDKYLNLVDSAATENPAGIFGGKAQGNQAPLVIDYPEEPVCGAGAATSESITGGTKTLSPGNFSKIKITGGDVTFSPGLYCMTGNLDITGGRSFGDGVTFYIKSGDVTINGNATALLAAPTDPANKLFGFLFFMDDANSGTIKLVGTNSSYFAGVVYAPSGYIDIGGTSSTTTIDDELCAKITALSNTCEATTFSTQFIGNVVRVRGDGQVDILYNESAMPGIDTRMYLRK